MVGSVGPHDVSVASVPEIVIAVVPVAGFIVFTEPVAQIPSSSVAQPITFPVVTLLCSILRTPLGRIFGIIAFQLPAVVA